MPSSTTAARCQCVVLAQAQQRQRHADVVVEVALRWPARRRRARRAGCDAIICVTVVLPLLPVTAISGRWKLRAPGGGQLLPAPAACRRTSRPGRPARLEAAVGERGDRAGRLAPAPRKSLASKRSPFSATNRSPALQRAGVGVHAVDRRRAVADQRARRAASACAWRQRHHRMRALLATPARALRIAPRRRTACLHAGDLLVVLVALAGDQHHVVGAGLRPARRAIAARAVGDRPARGRAPAQPGRIWR